MIRPIYLYDSTVLRMPTKEVILMTPEIEQLILDMSETLQEVGGLGLSAPQVGESYKIVVLTNGQHDICFINPYITEFSLEQEEMLEGCLSFPGLGVIVQRPKEVTLMAQDVTGEEKEYHLEGMLARVIQHELDHLNGILMTNRASKWNKKQNSYIRKYNKLLRVGKFVPKDEREKYEVIVDEPDYGYVLDNGQIRLEKEPKQKSRIITE